MASYFVIASVLFAGFLAVLAAIAFAAYRFAARPQGPALGVAGGCALAAVLMGAGFLALIAFLVLTTIVVAHRVVTDGPIQSVHVTPVHALQGSDSDEKHVRVEFTLRGDLAECVDEDRLDHLLREWDVDLESVDVQHWESEDGPRASVLIELQIPWFEEHVRHRFKEVESDLEWRDEGDQAEPAPVDGEVRQY